MFVCHLVQFDVTVKHDSWVTMHVAMVEAVRSLTYMVATVNSILIAKKVSMVKFGRAALCTHYTVLPKMVQQGCGCSFLSYRQLLLLGNGRAACF